MEGLNMKRKTKKRIWFFVKVAWMLFLTLWVIQKVNNHQMVAEIFTGSALSLIIFHVVNSY